MVTTRFASSAHQIARLALVAILGFAAVSNARAAEASYAQRLACTADAFRLCASEMPNSDAVRACMLANKAQLSAGCLATFKKNVASR
jgi:hypothetical protein